MKGTFEVFDGKPYVVTKKKKFKLTNVSQVSIHNQGMRVFETRQIWNVVPFTDRDFWATGKKVPVLNSGQEIEVEKIQKKKAKVKRIIS